MSPLEYIYFFSLSDWSTLACHGFEIHNSWIVSIHPAKMPLSRTLNPQPAHSVNQNLSLDPLKVNLPPHDCELPYPLLKMNKASPGQLVTCPPLCKCEFIYFMMKCGMNCFWPGVSITVRVVEVCVCFSGCMCPFVRVISIHQGVCACQWWG